MTEGDRVSPILGVRPETYSFLLDAKRTGSFDVLEVPIRNLVLVYFGTHASLSTLSRMGYVGNRGKSSEGLRLGVVEGLSQLWEALPESLKLLHDQERALHLKDRGKATLGAIERHNAARKEAKLRD